MLRSHPFVLAVALVAGAAPTAARAHHHRGGTPQACSLTSAAVGQPGTIVCKDALSGATTQSIPVGNTVSAAGGVGGNFSRGGDRVLVTNQAGGALLFREDDGRLTAPVTLQAGGEGSLSGALGRHGAYVVTGTRVLFFPRGETVAASSQKLLRGDGSASQIALAGGYAYVAEKSGSLEAFLLGKDGNLVGAATAVSGITAGTIVGIAASEDIVVAPIAHLAANFNGAQIPVVSGLAQVQSVATRELAPCWAASDDGAVCVSNPGSMTVSCGRVGPGGLRSFTSVAANPVGEAVFDLDLRDDMVAIQSTRAGAPMIQLWQRSDEDSDFLSFVAEHPLGAARATGALLLPALGR